MSCEQYKSRIAVVAAAFRPASSTPSNAVPDLDLAAHLAACPACRAEFDTQRALLASIDRGLASMVAGKPAGDFAAHVRSRIAQEGIAPRPWFAGWLPVTAAALALVVLVGVLTIGRPPRLPQSTRVTPPAPVAPAEKPHATAPPEVPRTEAPTTVAAGRRPPREGQSAANREPEVLVPRGEMAAVMRLFNANWEGKADGASLMAAAMPTTEILKPLATPELKISPLEIERLDEKGKPKGSSENR
ncbi:MAG: hypothetical protein HY234_05825 [Acidobacteria bacterium]|nr:hypothetical protein [Acidobacteriota bacterium]MBI3662554.1 hypothetical protein [Acidobacteriota bacterium]